MKTICHYPEDITVFKNKALQWATSHEVACYFDSNGYPDPYSAFDVFIAAGTFVEVKKSAGNAFGTLKNFLKRYPASFCPGFLSYDLKNELETLSSDNQDNLNFPDLFFFVPKHIILINGAGVKITSETGGLPELIENEDLRQPVMPPLSYVNTRYSRKEYIESVNRIKKHIARGDIYEMNFCQEFYAENTKIDPLATFKALNKISPAPFSVFFKHRDQYIISATPERFLSRRGNKVISQPIKGTAPRSPEPGLDMRLKNELRMNLKEQSENVMIVDLVRNDLTKCAVPGTVEVEELFGIYSFKQVHQMISTIVCEVAPDSDNTEIIAAAFPMGSMTGAPKVRAMEIIEQYERTKRGIFSGAVGYFAPDGDFDFNVIIRSLLYNSANGYLSFQTGSAITFASDPEKEYEECILKAKAILEILGAEKSIRKAES